MSGADRALVVGGARAVRRADLDEPRARAREHVGDAEAVADLDQLAARDEHLAALGERGEREQHRGGVVVHDERGLGAGQPAQDRGDVILPRAARARLRGRTRGSSSRARSRPPARAPPRAAARGRGSCARSRRSRSARAAASGARAAESSPSARSTRSPGSWPARISSRARASTARAASTASGGRRPAARPARARPPKADRADSSARSLSTLVRGRWRHERSLEGRERRSAPASSRSSLPRRAGPPPRSGSGR